MPIAVHHPMTNCQPAQATLTVRAARVVRSVRETLRLWGSRIRDRHAFPALDDRDLRDLRMTRWELEQELRKPFWRG